jgi:hypothetical protein
MMDHVEGVHLKYESVKCRHPGLSTVLLQLGGGCWGFWRGFWRGGRSWVLAPRRLGFEFGELMHMSFYIRSDTMAFILSA